MSWKTSLVDFFSAVLEPGWRAEAVVRPLSALLGLVGPRKDTARRNLRLVLPDASPTELEKALRGTYENIVRVGVEVMILQRGPEQALEWVEPEGEEHLEALRGKPVISITGHVGNWELLACWLAQRGYKITAIVREPDDPDESGLITAMRARMGVASLSKRLPMTRAVSLLKRGELLGILPDQHGGVEGIPSPFFGLETPTSIGPAVFAWLTGAAILPVSTRRVAPFRHKLRIAPPIEWQKLDSRDETIREITGKVNAAVEDMIREAPDQWLAQHKRFRERGGSLRA